MRLRDGWRVFIFYQTGAGAFRIRGSFTTIENYYLLVLVDGFTKLVIRMPVRSVKSGKDSD